MIPGGVILPQDYDYLRDAGVQGIYGPGSNVVECAADVLRDPDGVAEGIVRAVAGG